MEAGVRDIVFFDGECRFCEARVRWLRARDRAGSLSFAPLQGELAARLLGGSGACPGGAGADVCAVDRWSSMVLVMGAESPHPEVLVKSRAVAAVAARLPFPWCLGGLLALLPRGLADAGYDWVARRRHRWGRGPASTRCTT